MKTITTMIMNVAPAPVNLAGVGSVVGPIVLPARSGYHQIIDVDALDAADAMVEDSATNHTSDHGTSPECCQIAYAGVIVATSVSPVTESPAATIVSNPSFSRFTRAVRVNGNHSIGAARAYSTEVKESDPDKKTTSYILDVDSKSVIKPRSFNSIRIPTEHYKLLNKTISNLAYANIIKEVDNVDNTDNLVTPVLTTTNCVLFSTLETKSPQLFMWGYTSDHLYILRFESYESGSGLYHHRWYAMRGRKGASPLEYSITHERVKVMHLLNLMVGINPITFYLERPKSADTLVKENGLFEMHYIDELMLSVNAIEVDGTLIKGLKTIGIREGDSGTAPDQALPWGNLRCTSKEASNAFFVKSHGDDIRYIKTDLINGTCPIVNDVLSPYTYAQAVIACAPSIKKEAIDRINTLFADWNNKAPVPPKTNLSLLRSIKPNKANKPMVKTTLANKKGKLNGITPSVRDKINSTRRYSTKANMSKAQIVATPDLSTTYTPVPLERSLVPYTGLYGALGSFPINIVAKPGSYKETILALLACLPPELLTPKIINIVSSSHGSHVTNILKNRHGEGVLTAISVQHSKAIPTPHDVNTVIQGTRYPRLTQSKLDALLALPWHKLRSFYRTSDWTRELRDIMTEQGSTNPKYQGLIYTIVSPDTGIVLYVGSTYKPLSRLGTYLNNTVTHLNSVMRQLLETKRDMANNGAKAAYVYDQLHALVMRTQGINPIHQLHALVKALRVGESAMALNLYVQVIPGDWETIEHVTFEQYWILRWRPLFNINKVAGGTWSDAPRKFGPKMIPSAPVPLPTNYYPLAKELPTRPVKHLIVAEQQGIQDEATVKALGRDQKPVYLYYRNTLVFVFRSNNSAARFTGLNANYFNKRFTSLSHAINIAGTEFVFTREPIADPRITQFLLDEDKVKALWGSAPRTTVQLPTQARCHVIDNGIERIECRTIGEAVKLISERTGVKLYINKYYSIVNTDETFHGWRISKDIIPSFTYTKSRSGSLDVSLSLLINSIYQ